MRMFSKPSKTTTCTVIASRHGRRGDPGQSHRRPCRGPGLPRRFAPRNDAGVGSLAVAAAAMALGTAPALADDLAAEVAHSWTSGGEAAAVGVIVDAFEARGGQWQDWSIAGFENADAAFVSRLLAGDPPTAKVTVAGPQAYELVEQNLLNDIDATFHAAVPDGAMPPALVDAISYDGTVYMAPTGLHGESWMFYSMPVFAAAGVTALPTTWDELFAALDKVRDAGLVPVAWGGQSWQEAIVFRAVLLSTLGVDAYTRLWRERDESVAASPEFAEAVAIFARFRDYVDEGAPGRNWNDATAMVITDQAALQIMGDWAKGEFIAAGETVGEDYGCMLMPGDEAMVTIADAFVFPVTGDAADAATQQLLAEVILDPAVQAEFSALKGSFPARTDVDVAGLDICAQTGLRLLAEGRVASDSGMMVSPAVNGAFRDLVGEFFADPSMTPEDFVEGVQSVLVSG